MKDFGFKLKEYRHLFNYSQKKVCEAIGVSQSTYANYENGFREPPLKIVKKLSELYGITIDELINTHPKSDRIYFPTQKEREALEKKNLEKKKINDLIDSYNKLNENGKIIARKILSELENITFLRTKYTIDFSQYDDKELQRYLNEIIGLLNKEK